MHLDLLTRDLADRWRGLVAWALGLIGYAALIVSIYPTVRDSDSLAAAVDDYPDVLKEFFGGAAGFDFSTGAGFVNAEMYGLALPVVLVIVAIGMGAVIGTDQRSGLMDLILANPIARRRVVAERALGIVIVSAGLAGISAVALAVAGVFVDLGITASNLAAATVAIVLLVVFHGLLALAVGAATGTRSVAIGSATVVFVVGYVLTGLGGLVDWLEPLRAGLPYHKAVGSNPLVEGWDLAGSSLLVALCVITYVSAVVLFERRDVG